MLSGTGSNRGTKCIPRLARFNPRLALIGFPGTRARVILAVIEKVEDQKIASHWAKTFGSCILKGDIKETVILFDKGGGLGPMSYHGIYL